MFTFVVVLHPDFRFLILSQLYNHKSIFFSWIKRHSHGSWQNWDLSGFIWKWYIATLMEFKWKLHCLYFCIQKRKWKSGVFKLGIFTVSTFFWFYFNSFLLIAFYQPFSLNVLCEEDIFEKNVICLVVVGIFIDIDILIFDGRTHRQWYPIVNNFSIISSSLSMLSLMRILKVKFNAGHRISRLEKNFTNLLL